LYQVFVADAGWVRQQPPQATPSRTKTKKPGCFLGFLFSLNTPNIPGPISMTTVTLYCSWKNQMVWPVDEQEPGTVNYIPRPPLPILFTCTQVHTHTYTDMYTHNGNQAEATVERDIT